MDIIYLLASRTPVYILAIDWGRVGKSALIGAVIGGVIGAVITLTKKKNDQ